MSCWCVRCATHTQRVEGHVYSASTPWFSVLFLWRHCCNTSRTDRFLEKLSTSAATPCCGPTHGDKWQFGPSMRFPSAFTVTRCQLRVSVSRRPGKSRRNLSNSICSVCAKTVNWQPLQHALTDRRWDLPAVGLQHRGTVERCPFVSVEVGTLQDHLVATVEVQGFRLERGVQLLQNAVQDPKVGLGDFASKCMWCVKDLFRPLLCEPSVHGT